MKKWIRAKLRRFIVRLIIEDYRDNGEIGQAIKVNITGELREGILQIVHDDINNNRPTRELIRRNCNDPFRLIREERGV